MNAVLPQSKQTSVLGSQTTHNPFPEATAHIVGFNDTVRCVELDFCLLQRYCIFCI